MRRGTGRGGRRGSILFLPNLGRKAFRKQKVELVSKQHYKAQTGGNINTNHNKMKTMAIPRFSLVIIGPTVITLC